MYIIWEEKMREIDIKLIENVVENMVYIIEHGINNRGTVKIFEGKTIIKPIDYWENEEIQKQVYKFANDCIPKA